jgi:methionine-rich copper-binding protein CopC
MSDENVFEYSTFDHWLAKDENNTSLNADNYFTNSTDNTTPVIFNDNISKIESIYDTKTIGVSEGIYLEISGGLLFAVAPENKIENNQILKFDHWSSTTEDGVTFNNNSRYFSEMILNNESVEISANYICANCEGVPITISSNSNLTINEGQFICHPDFSIYVEGQLSDFSDAEYAWVEVNGEIFKLATPIIPKDYELNSAFPNPFNPTITIPFGLPLESDVSISIYNVMGQRIRLLQSDHIKAGFHQVQWKELTNSGHKVPSGMYIVKLNAVSTDGRKSFQKSQKIVLLK